MTAPDPHDVDEAVAGIVRRVRGLADQYRWLHPSAFRSPSSGPGAGSSHSVRDLSDTLYGPENKDDVVTGTSRARRDVTTAGRAILAAESDLAKAWDALMACQAGIEDRQPLSVEAASERLLARTVTKGELKLAKEAQGRRTARGEGFGQ